MKGVALFAGACTVPEARKQGAQQALLEARMNMAVSRRCDLAMMCAQPGSASQRNAEREGVYANQVAARDEGISRRS